MSPVRPRVALIGRRREPEHHQVRDFLTRIAQPYEWLEAGSVDADAALTRLRSSGLELPILIDGDVVLSSVTIRTLAEAWKMSRPPRLREYDIAIVGAELMKRRFDQLERKLDRLAAACRPLIPELVGFQPGLAVLGDSLRAAATASAREETPSLR